MEENKPQQAVLLSGEIKFTARVPEELRTKQNYTAECGLKIQKLMEAHGVSKFTACWDGLAIKKQMEESKPLVGNFLNYDIRFSQAAAQTALSPNNLPTFLAELSKVMEEYGVSRLDLSWDGLLLAAFTNSQWNNKFGASSG